MRWGYIGIAIGVGFALGDYWILTSLGSGLSVESPQFRRILFAFLLCVFALLGYALGRLVEERATVRHQIEALEKAQRALVQQEKLAAIGRLAAGVAHEVRNPLGVIRSSAAIIRENLEPDTDAFRACDFIHEETVRLNSLTTALLNFSRPVSAAPTSVRGDEMVESALRLAEPELTERRVEVTTSLPADSLEMTADRDLTTQAIFGLILNAAQAVAVNGTIRVSVERANGQEVRFEVADDGPGVSEDACAQIFEPFYTSKPQGTGLGLPMIRRGVEAQGGWCTFVPNAGLGPDGAGACFRIVLPGTA